MPSILPIWPTFPTPLSVLWAWRQRIFSKEGLGLANILQAVHRRVVVALPGNSIAFFVQHVLIIVLLLCTALQLRGQQGLEAPFARDKMQEDLQLFQQIRDAANSGVYKYRSKAQIDSIYTWAFQALNTATTYRDFYNILWQITDFEGSLHNGLRLPSKLRKSLREEPGGYFPWPIKLVEGAPLMNSAKGPIPLGAELLSINGEALHSILPKLYKYYTTDGLNISGKCIGINDAFAYYYRLHYGPTEAFTVRYRAHGSARVSPGSTAPVSASPS